MVQYKVGMAIESCIERYKVGMAIESCIEPPLGMGLQNCLILGVQQQGGMFKSSCHRLVAISA